MLRNNGWAGHPTFTHVPYTKSNTDDDRVSRFVRAAGWCPPRVERSMTYAWYSTVLSTF